MTHVLRYGAESVLRLELPAATWLGDFSQPLGKPLADPATATEAALTAPLDFPPLVQAVVPGDRVVIAVDRGVPQLPAVVRGLVQTLLRGAVEPRDITLLLADEAAAPASTAALAADVAAAVTVVPHHTRGAAHLAYLAAAKDGKPIVVNRLLFDADMVVPVGCLRPAAALGELGIPGGLFPTFSDEETQQRFQAPEAVESPAFQQRRRAEAAEAVWLLGTQFTCQLVPGPGDSLLHVLAGKLDTVAQRGGQACDAAWSHRVPRRASLVVATIGGGPGQQTWENFGRALFAAASVVTDGGAIVLCTDLHCPPGPALQRLTALEEGEATFRRIRRERSPDAVAAALLWTLRQRLRLYLLSGLESETVEELGLGYVSRAEEVNRLSQRYDSWILLADAHRSAMVAVT